MRTAQPHHHIFANFQQGNGLPAFRGGVSQRGYGVGGFFKGLLRVIAPKLKVVGKQLGKTALKTSLQTITDVANGENIKTAIKRRAGQNFKELLAPPSKRINSGGSSKSIISAKSNRRKGSKARTKNRSRDTSFGIF